MIGLTYAAAPFYSAFCRATGYEGTPQAREGQHGSWKATGFSGSGSTPMSRRASTGASSRRSNSVRLRTGKTATVYFRVRNLRDTPAVARATFNVSPEVSGGWFDKISCFCFTEQHLGPHESAEWPVVFFLDPKLETDPSMARVDSITLSYTLFAPPSERPAPARSADRAGPAGLTIKGRRQ